MSNASFETLCLVEFTCGVSVDLINYVYQRIQSPKLRPKIEEEDEDNCCVHTHHDADSNSSQPQLLTRSLSYKDGAELQCLKQMHSPSTEDGGRSETQVGHASGTHSLLSCITVTISPDYMNDRCLSGFLIMGART